MKGLHCSLFLLRIQSFLNTLLNCRELIFSLLMVASIFPAGAQDTLYFRDGTFATGKIRNPGFRKFTYMQYNEAGDSLLKKEKSAQLDSICFQSGLHFRVGTGDSRMLTDENLRRFAFYWQGRQFGNKRTVFSKAQIAANFLAGLTLVGLPYTMYVAGKLPPPSEIPTDQTKLMNTNKDFAKGFSEGVKRTNMNAFFPIYLSGVLTTLLGFALLLPR